MNVSDRAAVCDASLLCWCVWHGATAWPDCPPSSLLTYPASTQRSGVPPDISPPPREQCPQLSHLSSQSNKDTYFVGPIFKNFSFSFFYFIWKSAALIEYVSFSIIIWLVCQFNLVYLVKQTTPKSIMTFLIPHYILPRSGSFLQHTKEY